MVEDSAPPPAPRISPWYRLGPVLAAAAIYLLCIGHTRLWEVAIWPQGMAKFGVLFLDLRSHLAIGEAVANDSAVLGEVISADPMNRAYFGPRSLYWFGYLGLKPDDTEWFGAVLITGFLLAVGWLFRPRRLAESVYLLAALLSPPILLLVERGNIDLLSFAVLGGAFSLMARPRLAARWGGWSLVTAFISFKCYPALGYGAYLEGPASRREKCVALGLGLLAVLAFVILLREEFRALLANQVENRLYPFFGARELWVMLDHPHAQAARLGLLAWPVASSGLAWLLGPLDRVELAFDARKIFFVGGAAILVFCFLVTSSPDYRLVHFLFCLPWLAALRDGTAAPALRRVSALCLGLFLAVPWFGTLSARSALALESGAAWSAALLLKQLGWWALMTSLGALLLRLLVARGLDLIGRGVKPRH